MESTGSKARALLTEQVRLKKKTYRVKYANMLNKWEDRRLRFRILELNARENVARVNIEQRRLKFTHNTRRFFRNFSKALNGMEEKGKPRGMSKVGTRGGTFDMVLESARKENLCNGYAEKGELKTPDGDAIPEVGLQGDEVADRKQASSRYERCDADIKDVLKPQKKSLDFAESDRVRRKFGAAKLTYPITSLKGPYMSHKVKLNDYKVIPKIGDRPKEGDSSDSKPAARRVSVERVGKDEDSQAVNNSSENGGANYISTSGLEPYDKEAKSSVPGDEDCLRHSVTVVDKIGNTTGETAERKTVVKGEMACADTDEVRSVRDSESRLELHEKQDLKHEAERMCPTRGRECTGESGKGKNRKGRGKNRKDKKAPPGKPTPCYIRVPQYTEFSVLKNRMVVHRDVMLPKCLLTSQEREVVRRERYENWFKNIRVKHDLYVRKHRGDVAQWLASL